MQLQKSFAPPVAFSSLSSAITQQLLETNEGRNLCRERDKVYLKDIFVETFDCYYFGNSYVHFWILSKIVGFLSDNYWNFHESYDIRGCCFSSYMKLFIVAK